MSVEESETATGLLSYYSWLITLTSLEPLFNRLPAAKKTDHEDTNAHKHSESESVSPAQLSICGGSAVFRFRWG